MIGQGRYHRGVGIIGIAVSFSVGVSALTDYKTPEQIAASQRAEQERIAKTERRKRARENKEEEERCDYFKLHQKLIREADTLHKDILQYRIQTLPPLVKSILRFSNSTYQGIPEINGWNLFSAVVFREDNDGDTKSYLLSTLIEHKGYAEWQSLLFNDLFYSKILETYEGYDLLHKIYLNSLVNKRFCHLRSRESF